MDPAGLCFCRVKDTAHGLQYDHRQSTIYFLAVPLQLLFSLHMLVSTSSTIV